MGVDAPPSIKLCPYFIDLVRELKKNKLNNTVLEIRESKESEDRAEIRKSQGI